MNVFHLKVKAAQSCLTLCNPMDCTVHGILQARILEWVAFAFSGDIPNRGIKPRSPALQVESLPAELSVYQGVGKESTCNARDRGLIPGLGRSAGEGIGYHSNILGLPLQLSWKRISLQCRRSGFDPRVGKIPREGRREDSLEKGNSTLSSILAWRIPWTVSMWSQRVRHD